MLMTLLKTIDSYCIFNYIIYITSIVLIKNDRKDALHGIMVTKLD